MQTVNWRSAWVAMLALLALPASAELLLTVSLQPPSFAQLGDEVTVTITARDEQGNPWPMEDVSLGLVGSQQRLVGITGVDGRMAFTVTHDDATATSYEYAARSGEVEQRVTIPVAEPTPDEPALDTHDSAMAFLLNSPGTEPSDDLLADPALLTATRQGLINLANTLRGSGTIRVLFAGSAWPVFADGEGRRLGNTDDGLAQEIPGARFIRTSDGQWFHLPADAQYQLTIEGRGADFGTLTLLAADETGLAFRVFDDIPLDEGSRASVPIMSGGSAQAVLTADGLVPPSVAGVIDPASPAWSDGAQATEAAPDGLAEGSVIERALFCTGEDANGQLTGVGTTFPVGTTQVGLYIAVRDAPPGTELDITWKHEGDLLRRQILEAEGTGSSLTYLMAANRPDLWQGDYAVTIEQDGQLIATLSFAVR